MSDKYILVNGEPQPCDDLQAWAVWYEHADKERVVEQTVFVNVKVSTVFLGLDHSFGRDGAPLLWETMIFGGPHDGYQERYATREEAVQGHAKARELANG